MQAISFPVQGEEKFRVEKRLLYASASARFTEKSDADTLAVAVGIDEMIVGTFDMVTEVVGETDLESVVRVSFVVVMSDFVDDVP